MVICLPTFLRQLDLSYGRFERFYLFSGTRALYEAFNCALEIFLLILFVPSLEVSTIGRQAFPISATAISNALCLIAVVSASSIDY